jgi:uncharacterized protein YgiM (DUF1202 family)
MKKRLFALLLVLVLLIPAGIASAATWYRVNTTSLKVRFMPSENAEVLGSYRKDYALTIKSTKDGWSLVTFSNGFQGYVQTKYLTKGSSYSAWIYSDDTALRKGPDGSFAAKANLARGLKVKVLTHGASYDFVDAGSLGTGYVRNSLLSKKKIAASGSASTSNEVTGADYDAWVMGTGKVNLRQSANSNAAVIASYAPGTKIHVISHGPTWDRVTVDGNTGWMMTKFISTREPAPTPTPAPTADPGKKGYTAYVVSANKKAVHVRKGPSKNYSVQFSVDYGTPVLVLDHGKTYDKIKVNGRTGYMQNSFLQLAKPSDAGNIVTQDPNITPAPTPKFEAYYTTVKVNDLNFHKQKGDWASNVDGVGRLQLGNVVKVLSNDGSWAKVEYNGKTGWVHSEFLND